MKNRNKVRITPQCIECLIRRQVRITQRLKNPAEKMQYMKEVMQILVEGKPEETAPVLVARINQMQSRYFGTPCSFENEKKFYNDMLLAMEEEIENIIRAQKDPIYCGLQYARAGNYVDFGALGNVNEKTCREILTKARQEKIDEDTYVAFVKDLSDAEQLVYLTDNCGEVVLDKILIKILQETYPHLSIQVIVRGKPVLNDVTMTDAEAVGLTELVPVVSNGTGIGGTWEPDLSEEAREILRHADVILSKGQGNFETLYGCGYNVYYAFLCKCELFTEKFGMDLLQGVFINDKEVSLIQGTQWEDSDEITED